MTVETRARAASGTGFDVRVGAPVVFALPPCRRIVAAIPGLDRGAASIARFPNGELHARVGTAVEGRRCMVVGSIAPPETRLGQMTLLAHALRRAGAAWITAVAPYLAYARQDRAGAGESLGLAWAGELLRASGVDDVLTVDVHSPAAFEVLGLPLTSLPAAGALAPAIPAEWRGADVTFVAPDEGAADRCRALADAVGSPRPIAVLAKRRSATGVVHTTLSGEVGRRAVIVDDILDTGATLLSCARWLAAHGVESPAVAVTHGVLTGSEWLRLPAFGVHRIWMTDSVGRDRARAGGAEVVPVAPLLTAVLSGRGESEMAGGRPPERD
jgi:ribose-phosphate pyrophosphokinase